jgi:hypothetical protein
VAVTAAPAVLLGRCNPYGAETGGPRRILGGLHGPNSARLPDAPEYAGIPENVAQGEWACTQPAQIRCRMICQHGHKGQIMQLCSWHDENNYRGEYVAGTFRQVRETIRQHGHYEEIQKRQAGSCPPCLFPKDGSTDYAQLYKDIQIWQNELAGLFYAQKWQTPRAQMIKQAIEDAGRQFDQGRELGIIHNCPLTLVPVS